MSNRIEMDFTYGLTIHVYIYIHVMESFLVLFCPSYCFLILMQNGNPPPYFIELYPDLISPLLLFLALHPARPLVEDDDAVQFLACARFQPNSIEHVSNYSSFYIHICTFFSSPHIFPRTNHIRLLWSCPQNEIATDVCMSLGICFFPCF